MDSSKSGADSSKSNATIILAIVGSRNYVNNTSFNQYVDQWIQTHGHPITIVSGGAEGADHLAEVYARKNNIHCEIMKADWRTYGKRAGPIRNSKIVEFCTHVLAFPSHKGKGTQDTIRKAQKAGKHITIHYIDFAPDTSPLTF